MKVRVTRFVHHDEPHNWFGQDVESGHEFYRTRLGLTTFGAIDEDGGVALTEDPEGGYPFFEFPADAIEEVSDGR